MLCEECGQHEATVRETVIINGKPIEKNLCEQCAQRLGLTPMTHHAALHELVKQFVDDPDEPIAKAIEPTCPTCSMTYSRFKQTGLLGCGLCYKAFEAQIGPLIERAHEGATHHVGKIPRSALERSRSGGPDRLEVLLGTTEERIRRMSELRRLLDEAVRAEQFERAAALRDELTRLDQFKYDLSESDESASDPGEG